MHPRERAVFVSAYSRVLTSAWSNQAYAASLSADPRAALAGKGLNVPDGAAISIVRDPTGGHDLDTQVRMWESGNTNGYYELLVPAAPQLERVLSEAEMGAVAGDTYCCCTPCCSCT